MTPDALTAVVLAGDLDGVQELLRGADEPTRRACAEPARAAQRRVRRGSTYSLEAERAAALALAGTLPGAAAVAELLMEGSWRFSEVWDRVVQVLLERDPPWLPDVVERTAAFDPGDEPFPPWSLVEGLRAGLGLSRPRTAPYLTGLAGSTRDTRPGRWRDLRQRVRDDPELRDLLPDLLRTPDVGRALEGTRYLVHVREGGTFRTEDLPEDEQWPAVLRDLAAEGTLDRDDLLDVVLEVLALGGKANHLAWFLVLHDALAPTSEEVRARTRGYVAVCAAGSGTAARTALGLLKGLSGVGPDVVLQACSAALSRREKGLAVAALVWLEQARPDGVLTVLAEALVHERADVQERALRLALRLVGDGKAPTDLAAAAAQLPATLLAGAAPLLEAPVAAAVPAAAVQPGPLPVDDPPVADLRGLAEAVARLLETDDPLDAERVLDGLARLGADRAALVAALEPLRDRLVPPYWSTPDQDRLKVPVPSLLRDLLQGEPPAPRMPTGGLRGVLQVRAAEVHRAVHGGRPARVLALPDLACGLVDPDRVVATVVDGVGPVDLEQVLMRLPGPPSAAQLRRLRATSSGRALADVWEQGLPAVELVPAVVPARRLSYDLPCGEAGLPVVDVVSPATGTLVSRALTVSPRLSLRATLEPYERRLDDPLLALLTLPAQREVAAAHLLTRAVDTGHRLDARDLRCLSLLPDAAGLAGRATALALGCAMANKDLDARTAAVDAAAGLLAGPLAPGVLGDALAELLGHEQVKPGRVASSLGELLRVPGAAPALWEALATALPLLLATRRRGLHDLLAVAASAALAAGARGDVWGLSDVARPGSARLAVEARRLQAVLRATPG